LKDQEAMVNRQYYTIQEAALNADCSEDDIYHFIETDQLQVTLYTKQRQFCVASKNTNNQFVIHGTAWYRGLISVHNSWIKSLLENGKITLNRIGTPLTLKELAHYTPKFPFSTEKLPDSIEACAPCPITSLSDSKLYLLPAPTEIMDTSHVLKEMLLSLSDKDNPAKRMAKYRESTSKTVFDFTKNGSFELADMRISEAAFESLSELLNKKDSKHAESPAQTVEANFSLAWCNKKANVRRIDPVIERVYQAFPNAPSSVMWEKLMEDCQHEDSRYDIEGVID